jgi:hypothetical protein
MNEQTQFEHSLGHHTCKNDRWTVFVDLDFNDGNHLIHECPICGFKKRVYESTYSSAVDLLNGFMKNYPEVKEFTNKIKEGNNNA